MKTIANIAVAGISVFCGSLFADAFLGDGIQGDDIQQAFLVGFVAAFIQYWLNRKRG